MLDNCLISCGVVP